VTGTYAAVARCSRQNVWMVPGRSFPRISRTRASWARESIAGVIVAPCGPVRVRPRATLLDATPRVAIRRAQKRMAEVERPEVHRPLGQAREEPGQEALASLRVGDELGIGTRRGRGGRRMATRVVTISHNRRRRRNLAARSPIVWASDTSTRRSSRSPRRVVGAARIISRGPA